MFNTTISYLGESIDSFSISRGGDWIDSMVARNFNLPESVIQAEKEDGLDLLLNYDKGALSGRIKKNLIDFYEELINYYVAVLSAKLKSIENLPKFKNSLNVVISGGTSLAAGFIDKFIVAMNNNTFPFVIGEVRHAESPLTSVANGCLIYSQLES
jgi:hypothetical protein